MIMHTTKSRIEEIIENECLLKGIRQEFIIQGKQTAGKLFAISGCFPSAVCCGVTVATGMAGEEVFN